MDFDHAELFAAIVASNHGLPLNDRQRAILEAYDKDMGTLDIFPQAEGGSP